MFVCDTIFVDMAETHLIASKNTSYQPYIDGLKGIAISMIVAFHLQFIYSGFFEYMNKFLAFSNSWLIMFLILSAYTLTANIIKNTHFNFIKYIFKRIVRLAPSYYVMLLISFCCMPLMIPTFTYAQNIKMLLEHVLFINTAPFDQVNQIALLGVEWYIPVQFWLYFLIPIVLFIIKKYSFVYIAILFASIYLHTHQNIFFRYEDVSDFTRGIQNFVWIYVLVIGVQSLWLKNKLKLSLRTALEAIGYIGCYIYFLLAIQTRSEQIYITVLLLICLYERFAAVAVSKFIKRWSGIVDHGIVFVLLVMFFKYILNIYYVKNPQEFMAFWSIAFILISSRRPWVLRKILENRFIVALGTYSYEIYLTHFFVMTAVGYMIPKQGPYIRTVFIIPITLFLSYILHTYISKPALQKIAIFHSKK